MLADVVALVLLGAGLAACGTGRLLGGRIRPSALAQLAAQLRAAPSYPAPALARVAPPQRPVRLHVVGQPVPSSTAEQPSELRDWRAL